VIFLWTGVLYEGTLCAWRIMLLSTGLQFALLPVIVPAACFVGRGDALQFAFYFYDFVSFDDVALFDVVEVFDV
jgi:hypothetical protein